MFFVLSVFISFVNYLQVYCPFLFGMSIFFLINLEEFLICSRQKKLLVQNIAVIFILSIICILTVMLVILMKRYLLNLSIFILFVLFVPTFQILCVSLFKQFFIVNTVTIWLDFLRIDRFTGCSGMIINIIHFPLHLY